MLQYLLNVTATWLVSLILFDLLLRTESYHGYNRFYLLFTFMLGFLLPVPQLLTSPIWDIAALSGKTGQRILYVYLLGAIASFVWLMVDISRLIVLYRTGRKVRDEGWTIVETGKGHPPFSYLDILFVTAKDHYSNAEWEMIISHERQHSVLLHLIDMLMMQLAQVVFWFHPLVYIYQSRLQLVHEYQADWVSAREPEVYGKFLLEQSLLKAAPSFSHSFNRSPIKKGSLCWPEI